MVTLKAQGRLGEGVTCKIETGRALVEAGLHAATGGSGLAVCLGDLLLEALTACAGVTLSAVATALGIEIQDGVVCAEGDLDFGGRWGCRKRRQLGFSASGYFSTWSARRAKSSWLPCSVLPSVTALSTRHCASRRRSSIFL